MEFQKIFLLAFDQIKKLLVQKFYELIPTFYCQLKLSQIKTKDKLNK